MKIIIIILLIACSSSFAGENVLNRLTETQRELLQSVDPLFNLVLGDGEVRKDIQIYDDEDISSLAWRFMPWTKVHYRQDGSKYISLSIPGTLSWTANQRSEFTDSIFARLRSGIDGSKRHALQHALWFSDYVARSMEKNQESVGKVLAAELYNTFQATILPKKESLMQRFRQLNVSRGSSRDYFARTNQGVRNPLREMINDLTSLDLIGLANHPNPLHDYVVSKLEDVPVSIDIERNIKERMPVSTEVNDSSKTSMLSGFLLSQLISKLKEYRPENKARFIESFFKDDSKELNPSPTDLTFSQSQIHTLIEAHNNTNNNFPKKSNFRAIMLFYYDLHQKGEFPRFEGPDARWTELFCTYGLGMSHCTQGKQERIDQWFHVLKDSGMPVGKPDTSLGQKQLDFYEVLQEAMDGVNEQVNVAANKGGQESVSLHAMFYDAMNQILSNTPETTYPLGTVTQNIAWLAPRVPLQDWWTHVVLTTDRSLREALYDRVAWDSYRECNADILKREALRKAGDFLKQPLSREIMDKIGSNVRQFLKTFNMAPFSSRFQIAFPDAFPHPPLMADFKNFFEPLLKDPYEANIRKYASRNDRTHLQKSYVETMRGNMDGFLEDILKSSREGSIWIDCGLTEPEKSEVIRDIFRSLDIATKLKPIRSAFRNLIDFLEGKRDSTTYSSDTFGAPFVRYFESSQGTRWRLSELNERGNDLYRQMANYVKSKKKIISPHLVDNRFQDIVDWVMTNVTDKKQEIYKICDVYKISQSLDLHEQPWEDVRKEIFPPTLSTSVLSFLATQNRLQARMRIHNAIQAIPLKPHTVEAFFQSIQDNLIKASREVSEEKAPDFINLSKNLDLKLIKEHLWPRVSGVAGINKETISLDDVAKAFSRIPSRNAMTHQSLVNDIRARFPMIALIDRLGEGKLKGTYWDKSKAERKKVYDLFFQGFDQDVRGPMDFLTDRDAFIENLLFYQGHLTRKPTFNISGMVDLNRASELFGQSVTTFAAQFKKDTSQGYELTRVQSKKQTYTPEQILAFLAGSQGISDRAPTPDERKHAKELIQHVKTSMKSEDIIRFLEGSLMKPFTALSLSEKEMDQNSAEKEIMHRSALIRCFVDNTEPYA